MIVESPEVLPGATLEFVVPHAPVRICERLDVDPPTAAAFVLERWERLEPHEVAALAPQYPHCRGVWLRVRNDSSRTLVFRVQLTLGPDTAPVAASMSTMLERWRRDQRDRRSS
jgi:hypothetical protein